MRRMTLALFAVALFNALPSTASAADMIIKDASVHERAMHADLFLVGGFFGYTHVGLGGWFAYPIMPDGFIPSLNDAFFIEVGGAVERYSWDWGGWGLDCSYSWWRATPAWRGR